MHEKERQASEARKKQLEELIVKREADALFAKNEEEKMIRRFTELKGLQKFHIQQAVRGVVKMVYWVLREISVE